MSGRIERIFTAPTAGAPMASRESVTALAGRGLEDDRYLRGEGTYSRKPEPGRQITLIEAEVLEWLEREHGIALPAEQSRRNLLTRGATLNDWVGRTFRAGEVVLRGMRLCEPCAYLERITGKPVLAPLTHRGGLRAEILEGGTLRVGDPIALAEPAAAAVAGVQTAR